MADSKKYDGSTWQHSLRKLTTSSDTITTLPADLYADGNSATVGLVGNMSQTGTPTPQNPIQPTETGDKTANLFNKSNPAIFMGYYGSTRNELIANPTNAFVYIPLVQGRKYYAYGVKRYNPSVSLRWATTSSTPSNAVPCIRTGTFEQADILTITAETNENYLAIFVCGDSDYSAYGTIEAAVAANCANLIIDNGYKIPILSANTTTPVYLGEVQSTRKIVKYEFTGQENWNAHSTVSGVYTLTSINDYLFENQNICTCTHYQSYTNTGASLIPNGCIGFFWGPGRTERILYIHDDTYASATDFKTYLQQQYAAGTPVTIWYVLAEPTTGIVNEPIRKIGDYADSVSGITIPTITGKDTFDVQTTLKPSEVSLAYTGWHDATAKEWDGSEWQ